MNVFAIGASRNIGYHTAIRLLEKGATVTFLLRSTSAFDDDEIIKKYVASGHARLVKGDALKQDDVAKGWAAAQDGSHVDLVLFTVGGTPTMTLKGAVVKPVDLCTHCLLNVLRTMPESLHPVDAQPKFIIITSSGITEESHKKLPLALRIVNPWLLSGPHADKLGMERVLAHSAGWDWQDAEPRSDILPSDWLTVDGSPAKGELKKVLVVRPAWLTDGKCKGDLAAPGGKPPYRAGEGKLGSNNGYMVSRKDVAHFIVEGALEDWARWQGKAVTIAD